MAVTGKREETSLPPQWRKWTEERDAYRAPDSERGSWEALYEAYYERVLSYLVSRVNSRETAEDLCHDAFEKAFRAFPRFDESKASAATWIFSIARNTLTDHFRTSHTAASIDQETLGNELAARNAPETDLLREETLTLLADALRNMEQEEREIIVLRYDRGWSLTKIAKRIGVSYGMVKVKHRAALNKLKRALS